MEDPSENFQRVRDFVDVRNCSRLSQFQPACLRGGFTEDMVMEARTKLKINRVTHISFSLCISQSLSTCLYIISLKVDVFTFKMYQNPHLEDFRGAI